MPSETRSASPRSTAGSSPSPPAAAPCPPAPWPARPRPCRRTSGPAAATTPARAGRLSSPQAAAAGNGQQQERRRGDERQRRIHRGRPGRDRENERRRGNQAGPKSHPGVGYDAAQVEGAQGGAMPSTAEKKRAPNSLTPNSSKPAIMVQNMSTGFSGNMWPLNQGTTQSPRWNISRRRRRTALRPCPTAPSRPDW